MHREHVPILEDGVSLCGENVAVRLDETLSCLLVSGRVNRRAQLAAYVLPIYTDETAANYQTMTPAAVLAEAEGEFVFHLPLSDLGDIDSQYGEVFTSKIAVVATMPDGQNMLVDFAKYLENSEALACHCSPFPSVKSIKGVGLLMPSDLERLGVQHTSFNLCLWNLLTLTDHGEDTIRYDFEGETYYFDRSNIEMIDNTVRVATQNGMAIFCVVIMNESRNADPDSPARFITHPDTENVINLVAVNLDDDRGIQYYKAMMTFVAQRYTREDGEYGRLSGFIVGNEIGTAMCWNNIGNKNLHDYVEHYARWLRITHTIVKAHWSGARVYTSFDHYWNEQERSPNFVSYKNCDVLQTLTKLSRRQGDFGWDVAWHPYPEDIYKIDTWNDPNAIDADDTRVITFRNLQVLSRILNRPEYTYKGRMRRIILSEQGFTSGDNSYENQTLQAAAYAYAYYKAVLTEGVDIFSMNGHIDNGAEMGLSLGLWSAQPGTINRAWVQKGIYKVFKFIDTERSLEVTRFALDVIGESMGKRITDWKEVIPEFDEARIRRLCGRPAPLVSKLPDVSTVADEQRLDETAGRWEATDNTANLALTAEGPTSHILARLYNPGIPKDFKGITYVPFVPLDLTGMPVLSADVRLTGLEAGKPVQLLLRAYSGDRVMESSLHPGNFGEFGNVQLNLTGFAGIGAVDRIKIWARPLEDIDLLEGTLTIKSLKAVVPTDMAI